MNYFWIIIEELYNSKLQGEENIKDLTQLEEENKELEYKDNYEDQNNQNYSKFQEE